MAAFATGEPCQFDMPTRQSFLVQLIQDRKGLGNGIALNSAMELREGGTGTSQYGRLGRSSTNSILPHIK
jgi:hypothetical protein